jgi:hypothetical protein
MSGFTAGWLALREPADRAARSLSITRAVVNALPAGIVRAVDLATGTGANLRYLVPYLPPEQDWLLVDNDETLLSELPVRIYRSGLPREVRIECRRTDLSELEANSDIIEGRTLVTASALLDLVSAPWIASLAALCRRAGAVVLFALTYNGRITFSPIEPADDIVRRLVNRHQQTDKGFGPALGPDARVRAEQHFGRLGYRVMRAPSDWELGPDARDIQAQLIDGWTAAAIAMEPRDAAVIGDWQGRRQAHVGAGRSSIVVGHDDLAAIPG